MFERFTESARQVVVQAQHHARRFHHNYIGPEHLLLGVVTSEDDPVSALLRDLGLTPERTEAEFSRLTRSKPVGEPGTKAPLAPADPPPGPLAGLDADALAAIGIDLDEVRTRIEATFGPGALSRAVPRDRRGHPARRRFLRRGRPGPGRPGPDGRSGAPHRIPFTPRAKKVLELSLREAVGLGDNYIGMEHVALALIRLDDGVVPQLLARLDVSPEVIRAALLDQHRKAS